MRHFWQTLGLLLMLASRAEAETPTIKVENFSVTCPDKQNFTLEVLYQKNGDYWLGKTIQEGQQVEIFRQLAGPEKPKPFVGSNVNTLMYDIFPYAGLRQAKADLLKWQALLEGPKSYCQNKKIRQNKQTKIMVQILLISQALDSHRFLISYREK